MNFHKQLQRSRSPSWPWQLAATACVCALSACGGGSGQSSDSASDASGNLGLSNAGSSTTVVKQTQPANTQGRLLASNCFQCHGTGGSGGFESIRGGEADEVRKYRGLAAQPARANIMAAHAQGYTDAQIAAVITYLQQ